MTPLVIKQVERMAGRQGIPALKSRGRKSEINLTPLDMIQEGDGEYESDEDLLPELLSRDEGEYKLSNNEGSR